jgi:AcrR family transcriptional regulator
VIVAKQGVGPVRREQICQAAATVISEHGFAGATMRLIAEEAGVSTGMLNHYFPNRMAMLEETLVFISRRMHARMAAVIDAAEPGEPRLRALIRETLPTNPEMMETWRVWVAAFGASVRYARLREVIGARDQLWDDLIARTLDGLVPAKGELTPLVSEFDALLTGLVIKAIASQSNLGLDGIEEVLVRSVLRVGGRNVAIKAGRDRASRLMQPSEGG